MGMKYIDAGMLRQAFLAGAKGLEANKEWINELNVFPVPDGDTGTNMTMTILAAAKEVASVEKPTMESLAKAISSGSLRGARGNSGVILSQLFRGFAKEIKSVDVITTSTLARAMNRGTETAYKAVMKPKEGTILTVARGMADRAAELAPGTEDILDFVKEVIRCGNEVLSRTPDMLPILKEAGVVDSGGQGLMKVLEGAYDGLLGKTAPESLAGFQPRPAAAQTERAAGERLPAAFPEADIRFGYCTEFIINLEKRYGREEEKTFKAYLESIGDSIVVVSDDELVKVHVHTNDPGLAIQKALGFGSLSRMKIDNMREEHEERLFKAAADAGQGGGQTPAGDAAADDICRDGRGARKPYGFIAVCAGAGMGEIFKGLGADYLIEGGQTMNPSTEDMLNAVEAVNAETVFILPNNKNIILAAEQAAGLAEDQTVLVLPTKTIPQGITALINFSPERSASENAAQMTEEMARVKSGQLTYAVRNTMIDGMEIEEGDFMGIGDDGMLAVGKTLERTALDTLEAMIDGESELVTIYYGAETAAEDAKRLLKRAQERFSQCEIECHDGGQPVYYYVISVE
ncbi:DAK2 domain-containing protein [Clostridiaceae bacterium]|nr:DAK2 domain-containing protein [Clostridiaceae bacterium]